MEAEWFDHPEWWFGCSQEIDLYLGEKYECLLNAGQHDKLTSIDAIVLYDQLPRHIYRNQNAEHIITYFLQKALAIAININYDKLDDDRLCFALLPLRHSGVINNVYKALRIAWTRIKTTDSQILRRFLKATYANCPLQAASIAAPVSNFDRSILFFDPCDKPKHPYNFADLPTYMSKTIVLSISGGVDSMVCSWLICNKYPRDRCVAVHVNYNNRSTSDEEEKFVRHWCAFLGIKCYVRKIHEIQRHPCMQHGLRNTYETYTRNVRYQCYKQFPESLILLGHNRDDILENIFTNIAQKKKYDNLDGMKAFSEQEGIEFWRPMLHRTKVDICAFAHEFNIPYLPTSTPAWSKRGQIRGSVVPVLRRWDHDFTESLHELSSVVRDLYQMNDAHVDQFFESMQKVDGKVIFSGKYTVVPVFWREVFTRLCIHVSDKSMKHFIECLKRNTQQAVMICKSCKIHIKKNQIYLEYV